jgi:hypothetical protein
LLFTIGWDRAGALITLFAPPWQRGSRELLNQDFYSCGAESGYEHGQKYQSYGLAPGHLCF